MTRPAYPNDLTDGRWKVLQALLPPASAVGRPRKWSLRELLNGIFSVLRGGIAVLGRTGSKAVWGLARWRSMPHDLPPGQTVYHDHRLWRLRGVWELLHITLRELVRLRRGRDATPSAAIIDRQPVRTTGAGGPRGDDGGRKVNGRRRHLLVDALGLVLAVKVHEGKLQDRVGAVLLLRDLPGVFPRMQHV